jgi:hypothetical protein
MKFKKGEIVRVIKPRTSVKSIDTYDDFSGVVPNCWVGNLFKVIKELSSDFELERLNLGSSFRKYEITPLYPDILKRSKDFTEAWCGGNHSLHRELIVQNRDVYVNQLKEVEVSLKDVSYLF